MKKSRKIKALFFSFIMVLQVVSQGVDVVAYERGKVNLAPTSGNANVQKNTVLNEEEQISKEAVVQKVPATDEETSEYDESMEIKNKRTENSKTYRLSDGSYVSETYFEPIHKKEGDNYVDIDNTLENVSLFRNTPIYENKDGLYTFKAQDTMISMENETGEKLTLSNETANLSTYSVKENVILYSEAYANIDMEYRLKGNRILTNFYINGNTENKELSFTLKAEGVSVKETKEALIFLNEKKKEVFSYGKPMIYGSDNSVKAVATDYEIKDSSVKVTLHLDKEWINASERIYPLTMATSISDESKEINVTTAYNRSADPSITSNYYDLFVGYEDGAISGGTFLGVTRTYVQVDNLNLGADKEIINAKLNLYKLLSEPSQWNTIDVGKTAGYIKPSDCTWNNKPAVTNISTTSVRSDPGWQEFDVTAYIKDVYNGKGNTIELKATDESSAYTPNVFFSESGSGVPKISIQYRDAFDVDPSLPIDTFDTEMRIFSILNKGWEAFSFDGIARPDTQMRFDLIKRGDDKVIKSETSKGLVNKYFVDPIYITKHLDGTKTYPKEDVNYTTDYIYKDAIPEFDTPYEYRVSAVVGSTQSTKEFRSDSFIKYKVKSGDNLRTLASYYGLSIDDIKEDNNLTTNIIKEDDVLLLRFKKGNDKVSKDVYTPPLRTVEYKAKYVNRGPRCSSGSCPVIDPVNATTGNYYDEEEDFSIQDQDTFQFLRYYNSTGPQLSGIFGNGFTTLVESYISYDKKGNILYFTGDGKIFEFKKSTSGYEARKQDHMEIKVKDETVSIRDLDTEIQYHFDVYGTLSSMESKEGMRTTLQYDDYGKITAVQVGEKKLTFEYNDRSLVKKVVLPNGKSTQYEYDGNRNLTLFHDAAGNTKNYTYDKDNYLVSIKDKNNITATRNTYDKDGRVLEQLDGNGNRSTIRYEKNKTVITKGDGSEETYIFNEEGDILSITQDGRTTSAYTYDDSRNITSYMDEEGKKTTYTYQGENLSSTQYSDGTSEEYRYDTSGNITYQKDREGNVTKNTYQGNDPISTTDSNNTGSRYEYDSERRVIKETDQVGAVKTYTYTGNMVETITYSNSLVESFSYDANGNVVKESDNQGKLTTTVYNAKQEIIQKNYQDGTSEQWSYDGNGNVITYKDRIGGVTNSTYDKNNNLLTSTKGNLTTKKTYNEINQLLSETDEQGRTISYTYDELGNKTSETDVYGNATTYEYDKDGNISKTTDSLGNSEGNVYENSNLMKSISKEGSVTTYQYDSINREIKRTYPNGTMETKEYDGLQLKKETDGKGTTTEHFYDEFNREIKTITTYIDKQSSTTKNTYDIYNNLIMTNTDGAIITYTYDVYNQQVSTTDALGRTTKKEYDLEGNVIKEIDATGNAIITSYDGNKNILSTTDKNGNTEKKSYNALGQLINEIDSLGFVKSYHYNSLGQLAEIIDPYKRKAVYTYDEFGNVIETKLQDIVIETKRYDAYGREVLIENKEEKTSFIYDDFSRVIEKKDELTGLVIYTEYDSFGNITEEKDSEGKITENIYDRYNRKIKTIDAYGRAETNTYDLRDQITSTKAFDGMTTSSSYDKRGNIVKTTDALGKVTTKIFDDMNQLTKETVGKKVTEYVYDVNGQCVETKNSTRGLSTKTVYDNNGNAIETIDALGNSSKSEYDAKNQIVATMDANNNRSTKEYDAYGNVIKETDPLMGVKQHVYNEYGLLTSEVDERGFITTYEYNEDFQVIKMTDGTGNVFTIAYNDNRQKENETNSIGGVTSYEYDAYGREIYSKLPSGKQIEKEYGALDNVVKEINGRKTTIYSYDKQGRLTETVINKKSQEKNTYNKLNQIEKKEDAKGQISTYQYDVDGNVTYSNEKGFISEKNYDTDGNLMKQVDNKTVCTESSYDGNNRLIELSINGVVTLKKTYDANGNESSVIQNGVEVRNSYDGNNKLLLVEVPSSTKGKEFISIRNNTYDGSGNVISTIDANGNKEKKNYDANNNVIEEINKNGYVSRYEYDGMNNVIKAQNHEERYVSYIYDEAGNMKRKRLQNKIAEYDYDEDGNLVKEKDEYGYTNSYTYDVFGHRIEWIKPTGKKITYRYDALGNKVAENDKTFTYDERNNLLTSTNKEGTVRNTYNSFNLLTSTKDVAGNTINYSYDKDNRLSIKNYAGIEVAYSYNEYNQIDTISKDDKVIAKYRYNARNEVVELVQDDTITSKSYDDMGRLLTQKSVKEDKTVYDASYAYDANDNLIKEKIDGKENAYMYNGYDELSESQKHVDGKLVKTTYSYDLYGNQVTSSSKDGVSTYVYNEKNQVEQIKTKKGTVHFTYDENGNIAKKVNADGRKDLYTYDEQDQLTTLEQGHMVYDYRYDADNVRISQKITDKKDYHYDVWYDYSEPQDVVSEERIQDAFKELKEQAKKKKTNSCEKTFRDSYDVTYFKEPQTIEYTVDKNNEYAQVVKANDTVNVYGDELLSSNDETIINGWNECVVARVGKNGTTKYSYSDYGSTKNLISGNGYNGEMQDSNGLIYLRARYYDPSTARFIQIDNHYDGEKENVVTQNRYAYTLNNPYKYVDRNGNIPWGEMTYGPDYYKKPAKKQTKKKKAKETIIETSIERRGDATTYITRYSSGRIETETIIKKQNSAIKWTGGSYTTYYGSNAISQARSDMGVTRASSTGKGGGSIRVKPVYKKVEVTSKCPEKEWTDYVADIFGGMKNYFIDSFKSIEGIYNTIKTQGIVKSIKALYEIGVEYISDFTLDDAIAIYNEYSKFSITIDKIIVLIDCGFDLDKMANRYGYKSFGDWYGRNIAEGSTAIALKLLSDKFKAKFIKKEGVSGAKSLFDKGKDVFNKFNPNNAYVKPKHLSTSGGNGAKFLGGSKVESEVILREGLKNGTIKTIADNGITKLGSQSYEIIVDAGKVVGTKGETLIKVVLSEDGGMLSAYPVK